MKMEMIRNLRPEGNKRRRNSYISALDENNVILETAEMIRRKSVETKWNVQKIKLTNVISQESEASSECSISSRRGNLSPTRTPSSLSRSSSSIHEIELPEVFLAYPEITPRHNDEKIKMTNVEFTDRKDSLFSRKNSSSGLSIKRNDSGFSISTYQSLLAPSSTRHSAVTLNNLPDNRSTPDNMNKTEERRNSDQTYSRNYQNRQRRLSDQTFVKLQNFKDNEKNKGQSNSKESLSFTRDNVKLSPDDWKPVNSRENRQSLIRNDSETSLKSSRRGSVNLITPKMMRRRFSEQLILEGGLRSEAEFEDLVEEDAEESFTAANARKKVTLKRHYYPEGNYGYIVMFVAIIVQLLCHGLQLGSGVLMRPAMNKYHATPENAGKIYSYLFIC